MKTLEVVLLVALVVGAWWGVAAADCPEPAPDPVGWWEWVETCFFNSPDCNRPGEGRFYPVQLHFNAESEQEIYYEEDLQSVQAYGVFCLGNWVVGVPGSGNGEDIEVYGEPGSRRMYMTYQDRDGYTSSWAEREPIGTVPTVPGTWSTLKAAYR